MTELLTFVAATLLILAAYAQSRPRAHWENLADATPDIGELWFALLALLAWRPE